MIKAKTAIGLSLIILLIAPIFTIYEVKMMNTKNKKSVEELIVKEKKTPSGKGKHRLVPISQELIRKNLKTRKSRPKTYKISGVTWTNPPGDWWDTDWEYRVNVTVKEPNVTDRNNWPVDVYLIFNPPAFKYSIRVIRVSSGTFTEIPSQVWNVTYYNDTHLTAATVTFLVTISKNGSKLYQIYWSTDYTDPPAYPKRISVTSETTPNGDKYVISSQLYGWKIELPPENGGKAMNITLPTGDEIGHTWLHFGATRNPSTSYEDYWGTGNTNNMRYQQIGDRYIQEKRDTLLAVYEGVIFVTYIVEKVPLYDSDLGIDITYVYYTYRFYDWGFTVTERVQWITDDSGTTYYVGGWVFDLDDGVGDATFNYVYMPSYTEPRSLGLGTPIVFFDDMEHGSNGWVHGGAQDEWELGQPTYGPSSAYSGSYCWGTDLDNTYNNRANNYLQLPNIKLPLTDGKIYLEFYHWYSIEYRYDLAWVEISTDGSTWTKIYPIEGPGYGSTYYGDGWTGDSDGWVRSVFNLTEYQGQTVYINFRFRSDYSIVKAGWYIDDVKIYLKDVPLIECIDSWDHRADDGVAFYHNNTGRGIGFVEISNATSSFTFDSKVITWYSEGNDSNIDYIYWAVNYTNVQVTSKSLLELKYGIVMWNATGTPSSAVSGYMDLYQAIRAPLTIIKNNVEKFLITVNVTVYDDEGEVIKGAKVEFVNITSGDVIYSGYTDSSGAIIFDIVRYAYQINVTVTSGNRIYVNDTVTKNYSTLIYTIGSDAITIKFNDLIRLRLKALTDTDPKQIIQNGYLVLENASDTAIRSEAYTNLTGWIDIYIKKGNWNLKFNATVTTPETWDNVSLYSDSSFTTKVAGPGTELQIAITSSVTYWLVDHDITTPPVPTRLTIYNTLTFYEVYWTDPITIYVNLTREDTGGNVNGTLYWYVFNSTGYSVLNGTERPTATGSFTFTINTTNLKAATGYTIYINATPDSPLADGKEPLKPSPVTIGLTVKERPVSLDITFDPSNIIYWNESLGITTYLYDSLSGNGISNAHVIIHIYTPTSTIEVTLSDQGSGYYSRILKNELSNVDAGSYTMIIRATKANHETIEKSFTLIIKERPTNIVYDDYIEIPWMASYSIWIQYIDERYGIPIENAKVTYNIKNATTGSTIDSGPLSYSSGYYTTSLNLTSFIEGTYLVEIFAGRRNYENKTITITFVIRLHNTIAQADVTKISIYFDENVTMRITYYDQDFDQYIAGALASCEISGIKKDMPTLTTQLTDLKNGTYLLNIPAEKLNVTGSYTLTIVITKQHYEAKTIYASLVVNPIPTVASASKTSEIIEYGLSTTIKIWYNDSRTATSIQDPDNKTYAIWDGSTWIGTHQLTSNPDGSWTLTLDTISMNLVPGTYTVYVYLEKAHHENKTLVITLTVDTVATYAHAEPANVTLYWDETGETKVYWNRTRDWAFISGSYDLTVNDLDTGEDVTSINAVTMSAEADYYTVTINASKLVNGHTYVIEITFTKQHYDSATVRIYVIVQTIPTVASASKTSETLEYELSTTIEIWYKDARTSTPIQNPDKKTYEIWSGATLVGTYDLSSNPDGSWNLALDTIGMNLIPGTYTIYVYLEKAHHENKTLVITLTVDTVTTYAHAEPANVTLYWDETGETKVYWNRTRDWAFISGSYDLTVNDLDTGEDVTSINAVTMSAEADYYTVTINASKLVNGHTYVIEITFTKQHYDSGIVRIYVQVLTIPTIVSVSKSSEEIEWGMGTEITIVYTDMRTGEPIQADRAVFVIQNTTWSSEYELEMVEEGTYLLTIDTIEMHLKPDYYTITIMLERGHYENQTKIVTLTVDPVATYAYAQPENLTLYWGDRGTVRIYYNRSLTSEMISDATVTLSVMDITGAVIKVPEDAFVVGREEGIFMLHVDTRKLADNFVYLLNITLSKDYYELGVLLIFVRVEPIPVDVIITPFVADITWGDNFNFSMSIINLLNGSGVPDVSIDYKVYVGGEEVDVGDAVEIIQLDAKTYAILIRSGQLNTTSYNIFIIVTKPHHAFPLVNVTARIHPVAATVSIRSVKTVYKDPVTGSATTRVEIVIRDARTGAPLSNAKVKVAVMRGETTVLTVTAQEDPENPGVYVAMINWSQLEPGDYVVRVIVEEIQRGTYHGVAENTLEIAKGETEIGVSVDYFGGSTVIAGKRYPNLLVYPPLIAVLLIVGFVGYRYYAWFRLPIEVREVIKLLKKIQKDIYEYEAPTREDMFRELIATHLGLE